MTYYILYQITNNLNAKIYVGVHKTNDLNDGYMGSGKVINAAIAKYGIENFTKIILEQFETSTAMYAREKEVVTDEFLLREDTYNLRRGGFGGFEYINKLDYMTPIRAANAKKIPAEYRRIGGLATSSEKLKKAHAEGKLRHDGFKDKHHSNESKQKIGDANRLNVGDKNSQFGSMWITNEVSNKKIKKTDPVPEGWRTGRAMLLSTIG